MSRAQVVVLSVVAAGLVCVGAVLGYSVWDSNRDHRNYPASVRDSFLVSCAQQGGSDDRCKCALNAVEEAFTLADFTAFERSILAGGFPQQLVDVVTKDCGGTTVAAASAEATNTATIVGATDTDPRHWQQVGSTRRFDVRVYGDTPSVIQDSDFSPVMNGCGQGQVRVSWRTLGADVIPGLTGFLDSGMNPTVDNQGDPAASGSMVLSQCEQPVWKALTTSGLVDLVVEVVDYVPVVGD
jgi:hypothetical protein